MPFICTNCNSSFEKKFNLEKHKSTKLCKAKGHLVKNKEVFGKIRQIQDIDEYGEPKHKEYYPFRMIIINDGYEVAHYDCRNCVREALVRELEKQLVY